jgi:Zn2+/Cd2+-exporting ATPase
MRQTTTNKKRPAHLPTHAHRDCCSVEEESAGKGPVVADSPGHDHGHGHDHAHGEGGLRDYVYPGISFLLLLTGILLNYFAVPFFTLYPQLLVFGLAYVLVGGPVIWTALRKIGQGDFFNEFSLMGIATIGAFAIGEFAEGVAVMLFYSVGELFQEAAVKRSKRSIQALLQVQAEEVTVLSQGRSQVMHPGQVEVDEVIQVRNGEKIALDGVLLSERGTFNTAALTGESAPQTRKRGEEVLAGMINTGSVSDIQVTRAFEDTRLASILKMVQEAVGRKAPTQRFITRFAKVYTPAVVALAVALTFLPYLFVADYVFTEWLYRALVFLVISCPCALVVSIPLGYFGGIGAASRQGILFKGANYLDLLRNVDTVVLDKTGTLTKGVFQVQQVEVQGDMDDTLFRQLAAALEAKSTHPIAKAVVEAAPAGFEELPVTEVEEISGYGLRGTVSGLEVVAGNVRLLQKLGIPYDPALDTLVEAVVAVAINGGYSGYLVVADELKEDARQAIAQLRQAGVKRIVMLSGDKDAIVQQVAADLGLTEAYGDLLPEDKARKLQELKAGNRRVAFVGDGINDAPVLALADVGIAMGGLGSDVAIETADVVIQTDQPSRISTAIRVGRATHNIVWQNIALAFGVKLVVLALGAGGMASMWEAVFADVGVALLAILNAVRIQHMTFGR